MKQAAWALALLLSACAGLRGRPAHPVADLVFTNGAVYTVDARRSWAQAVAIADGTILYVGPDTGATAYVGHDTEVVDLQGKMLLPGFVDAHAHLLEGGFSLGMCRLVELRSAEAYVAEVKRYAAAHQGLDWVTGFGWKLEAFPPEGPSKEALDAAVPDRPAFFVAEDGHSAWLNSRALRALEIDAATPDPADGRIERGPGGAPSGTLRDGAATRAQAKIFDPGVFEAVDALQAGIAEANRYGITSVIEARANHAQDYDLLYRIADWLGKLNARVSVSLYLDPNGGDEQIDELTARYRAGGDGLLKIDEIKIYLDGVSESRTAALLNPYTGGDDRGPLAFDGAKLRRWARRLDRVGFQLHFHAIGDRAVREGLDVIAETRRANGPRDARPHLAHLYLVDDADRARFKELNATANVGAVWAFPSDPNERLDRPLLGEERYRRLLPVRSLADAGARLVAGSDFPVSTFSPLYAMQVAVTRQDPEAGEDAPVLNASERVDLDTILAAYTINGAYLQRLESVTGSIEPGKRADLVVLSANLFAISPYEIAQTRVELTMLEGRIVYRRPESGSRH